ncbi:MAG TPA: hypothetical protein VGG79_09510 [Roseiarcus sp.]|jgi:hypothetical protein
MRGHVLLYAVGLSLAIGVADPCAGAVQPQGAIVRSASDHNSDQDTHDLGFFAPAATSDDPAPQPSSASTAGGAEAVPELPIWAMMFVCFLGLALAGLKKGRKDRLSPGIE